MKHGRRPGRLLVPNKTERVIVTFAADILAGLHAAGQRTGCSRQDLVNVAVKYMLEHRRIDRLVPSKKAERP